MGGKRRGGGGVTGGTTRLRFSLLGEGETGSPRRRLRARLRALAGAGAGAGGGGKYNFDEEAEADGGFELDRTAEMGGKSSSGVGDGSLFWLVLRGLCFVGVRNGLAWVRARSKMSVFALRGEKGLNEGKSGVCSGGFDRRREGCDLGGVVGGAAAAFESFLYSLYFSAGMGMRRDGTDMKATTDRYEEVV